MRRQLFRSVLTENLLCPSCQIHVESVDHYFLSCVNYVTDRAVLLNAVDNSFINLKSEYCHLNLVLPNVITNAFILKLILSGFDSNIFSGCTASFQPEKYYVINCTLHAAVINFMYKTRRFVE